MQVRVMPSPFSSNSSGSSSVWQASRRGYRLCQPIECRNYYLGYEGMQLEMIKLIAEKQTATQAIQGKFSAEGLAKLAQQTDPRVRLAQSICEADTETQNELQNMFDAVSNSNNSSTENENELMRNYEPMKLFDEIVGIITTSNKEENVQKTAVRSGDMLSLHIQSTQQ